MRIVQEGFGKEDLVTASYEPFARRRRQTHDAGRRSANSSTYPGVSAETTAGVARG
jgi:hypothetical protein